MVLAELTSCISHRFENLRDGDGLIRNTEWGTSLPDRCQTGPEWQFAGDKIRPSGSAARFRIIVGEAHAISGQAVKVGRPSRHDALVVGADIGPADVIAHDDNDVWFLLLRLHRTDSRWQ